ncbi:hypothetical protein PQ455_10710 [Sphingomonas naphthae]|uniref:TIGR03067 domain-containing protein n=1 Tax=Sphingomonas naphthae TaxID=1813468 RepID=A0ABY7TH18_9SPHN|nr:hypothetical protein [Sphingomonas naphthae]WCT72116.1 hypothetical protein PQ455_10710 [Sphingomonas naphthae]
MRVLLGMMGLIAAVAAPAAAADKENPLLGAWAREAGPEQDWQPGDPRQQLTFTSDSMVIGTGEGIALRGYSVHQTTVKAQTRGGAVYLFRMAGPDRMCMVPAWGGARGDATSRCYVRRQVRYDPTLV